jgi:8-oxo-dGTP diphosphatase
VPGVHPHPLRPGGHAAGRERDPVDVAEPWWRWEAWWEGLDRFDQHYLWEAHEAWEALWRALPKDDVRRSVVQAMIELAGALLVSHLGRETSAEVLVERAIGRWLHARGALGARILGVDLDALVEAARAWRRGGAWPISGARRPVRVVGAVLVQQGRLLVARRGPALSRAGLWEIPGGKVERGESDGAALERELLEELGLEVRAGPTLSEVFYDYGDVAIVLAAVVAWPLGEVAPHLSDHDAWRWQEADALEQLAWAPADVPLLTPIRGWIATLEAGPPG